MTGVQTCALPILVDNNANELQGKKIAPIKIYDNDEIGRASCRERV